MSQLPSSSTGFRSFLLELQARGLTWQDFHQALRDVTATLTDAEAELLLFDWEGIYARPEQLMPAGDWLYWLIQAGRGYGKTRVGAESVRKWAYEMPGSRGFVAARTIADARDTCIEGESGLLACLPSHQRPPFGGDWNRSKGELWLGPDRDRGTYVKCFSSDEPESGRGPQFHWGWADELAAWLKGIALWDQLLFGLRLPWPGREARAVITTTPRPRPIIRELHKDPRCVVTRGTTYENLSNLSPAFARIIAKFEGTRLGRQELLAELLDDTPGALWTRALLELQRLHASTVVADLGLTTTLIGVDPAISSGDKSDETGIIVAAAGMHRKAGKSEWKRYVLEDVSLRGKPVEWATAVVKAYEKWEANGVVAEANQGGEMVAATIHAVDKSVPVKLVHASKGKRTRAEPVATAYERGDVFHVGSFPELEDQQCMWVPGEPSPDRMDAAVWVLTELETRYGGNNKIPPLKPAVRTGLSGMEM